MTRFIKQSADITRNILLLAFSAICVYPLLWTLMNSFKEKRQFSVDNMGFPTRLAFENYINSIKTSHMDIFVVNSLIVSLIAVLMVVAIAFVTGYVLSRYVFKAKGFIYYMFLLGMLIPVHGLLIPLFIQFKTLGLLNSRFMLAVTYCAYNLPLTIFLIESFVKSIPTDMEEAAYMDGAGTLQTMFRIIFPMTKPVLATSTVLTFLNVWNEFPFALVLASKKELKTIPIGMANFSGEFSVEYTQLLAASVLATLPVLIVYAIFSKRIVDGMLAGAVKG